MRRITDITDGARMRLAMELARVRLPDCPRRWPVLAALARGYLGDDDEAPEGSDPTMVSTYTDLCVLLDVPAIYTGVTDDATAVVVTAQVPDTLIEAADAQARRHGAIATDGSSWAFPRPGAYRNFARWLADALVADARLIST